MVLSMLCNDVVEGGIIVFLTVGECGQLSKVCQRFSKVVQWCRDVKIVGKKIGDDDVFSWEGGVGRLEKCTRLIIQKSRFLTGMGMGCNGLGINADRMVVLNLIRCVGLVDKDIENMVNLEVLKLPRCKKITNSGIKKMVRMRELDLSTALKIDDEGIMKMIGMTDLRLFFNLRVTIKGVEGMVGLKVLFAAYNRYLITSEVKHKLNSIEKLYLRI